MMARYGSVLSVISLFGALAFCSLMSTKSRLVRRSPTSATNGWSIVRRASVDQLVHARIGIKQPRLDELENNLLESEQNVISRASF